MKHRSGTITIELSAEHLALVRRLLLTAELWWQDHHAGSVKLYEVIGQWRAAGRPLGYLSNDERGGGRR